jgi:predicted phosphodiesterase
MRLLLLGDSHGHLELLHRAVTEAQELHGIDAAIQVGDFGFFASIFEQYRRRGLGPFPVPLHVIDGNHDDHRWLLQIRTNDESTAWDGLNLQLHERGTTARLGGITVGFIGGALHADRRQQWDGMWKPNPAGSRPGRQPVPRDPAYANFVTAGDIERALAAFAVDPPDLLVTHTCPAGIGIGIAGAPHLIEDADRFITRAGHHGGPFTDCGEGALTRLWTALAHRPPTWVFGHFHRLHRTTIGQTEFCCIGSSDDSDGMNGIRTIIYDTADRSLTIDEAHRLGIGQ